MALAESSDPLGDLARTADAAAQRVRPWQIGHELAKHLTSGGRSMTPDEVALVQPSNELSTGPTARQASSRRGGSTRTRRSAMRTQTGRTCGQGSSTPSNIPRSWPICPTCIGWHDTARRICTLGGRSTPTSVPLPCSTSRTTDAGRSSEPTNSRGQSTTGSAFVQWRSASAKRWTRRSPTATWVSSSRSSTTCSPGGA